MAANKRRKPENRTPETSSAKIRRAFNIDSGCELYKVALCRFRLLLGTIS